jgi:hypothetical protein
MTGLSDKAVKGYQRQYYIERERAKTKQELQRELKEKQHLTILKIKQLDRKIDQINFDVNLALKNIYLGLTGDRDDHFVGSQTLLEFGIEN